MLTGWGSNRWNQLGTGTSPSLAGQAQGAKLEPIPILENDRFSYISAGEGHSLLVTETGELMACGRGIEGQLGFGNKLSTSSPQVVKHVLDEVIVSCAAGAMHSLAVTSAGKVYLWGLIHVSPSDMNGASSPPSDSNIQDGTPLDGDVPGIPAGGEESVATAAAGGDARQMLGLNCQASDKLLRIVMESTEKWMTASDGPQERRRGEGFNDQEAAEEEEAERRAAQMEEERAVERGEAGDLGMMRMDMLAQRRPVLFPTMVKGPLSQERVIAVSAGFGHSLALTDRGAVYSTGYNDRGQLGLGHRVNCPTFQLITALNGRIVTQIACGSQHNLLRVLSATNPNVGECWVFGNGALGQLGLGRKVTGRRTPVHLPLFDPKAASDDVSGEGLQTLNVLHVTAGSNHSVCVARNEVGTGGVFTWGHGEYGQHGGKESLGSHDLVDSFYYYTPRRLLPQVVQGINNMQTTTSQSMNQQSPSFVEEFVSASCGSCFTIGLTSKGNVWSWGWNSHGVLGRGRGLVSHAPMKIQTLGPHVDREVASIAVGGNHCLALVNSSAAARAVLLRPLLNHLLTSASTTKILQVKGSSGGLPPPPARIALAAAESTDSITSVEDSNKETPSMPSTSSSSALSVHRTPYIEEDTEGSNTSLCDIELLVQGVKLQAHRVILEARCSYLKGLFKMAEKDHFSSIEELASSLSLAETTDISKPYRMLQVSMDSEFATAATIKALLIYLYSDTLECPPHRVDLLRKLALEFHLDRLVGLCVSSLGNQYSLPTLLVGGGHEEEENLGIPNSSFEHDLNDVVNSKRFADVLFYDSSSPSALMEDFSAETPATEVVLSQNQIWAHRCLLQHVDYFNTLFNGKYKEGTASSSSSDCNSITDLQMSNMSSGSANDAFIKIDLSGMVQDGLNFQTLLRLIRFVYTGSNSVVPNDDPNAITELAAAAERFGVISLVKICERSLVALVNDVENAQACIEFANQYHLQRLSKHCGDLLAKSAHKQTASSSTTTRDIARN